MGDSAFHYFTLANDLHVRLHGGPSGTAMYNAACCLALAVEAQFAGSPSRPGFSTQNMVFPSMPPAHREPLAAFTDARLDLAVEWLLAAVGAGYMNIEHMRSDPDLRSVHRLRPMGLQAAMQMAAARTVVGGGEMPAARAVVGGGAIVQWAPLAAH